MRSSRYIPNHRPFCSPNSRFSFRIRCISLLLCFSLTPLSVAIATPKEPPCRIKRTRADRAPNCPTTSKISQTDRSIHCFHRCLQPYSKDTFFQRTPTDDTYKSSNPNTYETSTPSPPPPKTKPRQPQAQINSEIWGGHVSGRLEQTLHSHNPLVQQCFQRYAVSDLGLLWMWVRFDVTTRGLQHVRTMCHNISNPNFRRCLLCAVSSLQLKAQKRPWRVAQSITRYPNPYDGRSRMATFRWKRPVPPHRRAGLRQVCMLGRRHQYTSPYTLDPFAARPCKKGLECCYPCGPAGCDYICLPRCPVDLP